MLHSYWLLLGILILGLLVVIGLIYCIFYMEDPDDEKWVMLGKHYGLTRGFPGEIFPSFGAVVNHYIMCSLGVTEQGLYLSSWFTPDLFIPWTDIELERVNLSLGRRPLKVNIKKAPEVNVILSPIFEEKIKAKAGNFWPGIIEKNNKSA